MLQIAIKDFSAKEITQVLHNTGYEHATGDFAKSRIAHMGVRDNGAHVFVISFPSSECEGEYYISKLLVSLNEKGLLTGEWTGMPIHDEMTAGEVEYYFTALEDSCRYKS